MDTNVAMLACATAMREHGLQHWGFKWMRSTKTLGMCFYCDKCIGLSWDYVVANDPAHVVDTIYHEIAHALAGHAAGHGPMWQVIAKTLGASPHACSNDHVRSYKYRATCQCGTHQRHGKPKIARRCTSCKTPLTFEKCT